MVCIVRLAGFMKAGVYAMDRSAGVICICLGCERYWSWPQQRYNYSGLNRNKRNLPGRPVHCVGV